MAAVVPSEEVGVAVSEEVGMAVLGKDMLGTPSYAHEQSLEDLETTLLWGEVYCNSTGEGVAMLEVSESDVRPSPEGSREEARVDNAVDLEAFSKMPTTEEEEEDSNSMPEVAAHVFVPIDPYCIERPPTRDEKKRWEYEEEEIVRCEKEKANLEKQNFLSRGYSAHHSSCDGEPAQTCMERLSCCSQNCRCSSASLKAVASMVGATTIFPCLLYGAYVFLPFDVPQMPTMSSRLVYTLRCGAFATFPIVVGMIVYGASRLCFSSLQPFGELRREVEIHRRYVSQSVHLFILYFFNIAVLSTYLPQENLKLIPLLTALFAISRLLYWLAYAMGRSFRGFGFGLTFLPLATMLLFNLYSMFLMDSGSLFVTAGNREPPLEKEQRLAASKPRYWG